MSGKMESSLWRPLQIAILIHVLTSTVLCKKKDQEPEPVANNNGDVCWKNFPDLSKKGGKKTPATDLASCQAACLQDSDCGSIDFDPTSSDCWLHAKDKKENKKGIQHYEYGCGGTSPPSDCRPTTTTSILEFNSPDYGRCTSQQNVTVTKCSGSCSDGGDGYRVFLSGTTTVLNVDKSCSSCKGSGGVKRYDVYCAGQHGWGAPITVDVEEFTECTCKKCTE